MFDEAKIRAEVVRRDELRREAHLPRLDIEAEIRWAKAEFSRAVYREFCQEHESERKQIEEEVLVEMRAKYGPDFGYSWGGRWMVSARTNKLFYELLAEKYGVRPPSMTGSDPDLPLRA